MLQCVSEFPSIFRLNNIPCVDTSHFVYSSMDGHFDCFHLLAIVNDVAINMGVQIHFWVPAYSSFEYIPRSGVAEAYGNTRFHFLRHRHVVSPEKAMAAHSSTLAWKIPWMEEPGRLQSMWSIRVGHDWATSLSLFTFMPWRRKWQPTPVFLPGESQGRGSLVGCHLWGRTESDTTEVT